MNPTLIHANASDVPAVQSPAVSMLRLRQAIHFALLLSILLVFSIMLQWLAGCYHTEFSGFPDEPAHLITGLMVRDYVISGMKVSPMQFAENYYLHYPKVGFGIWPPLFHFTEGAWFLIVPPSRASAFALQALITALLAASLAFTVLRMFGWILALGAGAVFVAVPTVQTYTGMVMADNLMALLAFWAMLAFVAYAKDRRMSRAILFGALIGLALMTKSNAACLAILPVVSLVLLRRYRYLYSPQLIVASVVALALALPWQLLVIRLWTGTVSAHSYSWAYGLHMLAAHTVMYLTMPGVVVCALAVLGFTDKVVLPYLRHTIEPLWASNTGLLVSLFLFGFSPLPPEPRYHVASIAGMALFAAAGVNWLATRRWGAPLPRPETQVAWRKFALVAVATGVFAFTTFAIPKRVGYGFTEVARAVTSNPGLHDSVLLASSAGFGEGIFIPEIALLEPRPTHYVLRASKILSTSRWDADSYQLLYPTPEAMMTYLQSIPVRLLVMDDTPGPNDSPPHHRMLNQMIELYKDRWASMGTYPAAGLNGAGGRVRMYRLLGAPDVHGNIEINMRYTLKKTLGIRPGQ